ncbi:hypothetical protein KR084_004687, partial [Drosophila pseudotakahashii]
SRGKEASGSKRDRPSDAPNDTPTPLLIAAINSRFDEQALLIKSTIREVEDRMLEVLKERLLGVTTEMPMADRMLKLEREVEELRSLKSQIGTVQGKLDAQRAQSDACVVRMHGVPFVAGEKLRPLLNKLCFSTNLVPAPRV